MAGDLPDENQGSEPKPFFSSPDLSNETGAKVDQFEEFSYVPGLFDQVTEVPQSNIHTYEFANSMKLLSMGELPDDVGEYYPFTDVALSFMPALEDSDRHELELVHENPMGRLSDSIDEDIMLRLLDQSLEPDRDTEEVRAHFNRLNKALWRTGTSGIFVVAHYIGEIEGPHREIKIAARVSSFILHENRATIEPVIANASNTQVGLLPTDFALAPKWLYLLQADV